MASTSGRLPDRGTSVTPPIPPQTSTPTHSDVDESISVKIELSPKIRSPKSVDGEDTCPICLGTVTDKCAAGSCLHNFCLVCLKEWSKQKAVCPLCKQAFTKILYDIRSESQYKEWVVPIRQPDPHEVNIRRFRDFFGRDGRRFFGYRSTHYPRNSNNTVGSQDLLNTVTFPHFHRRTGLVSLSPESFGYALPNGPPPQRRNQERRPLFNLRGSSMFRLSVYLNDIWVQPLADVTGRFRESSSTLYTDEPALTHRLVPWVNRELAALLPPTQIGYILTIVMDLIKQHHINSRAFIRALSPHLGECTGHFCHEFYHFARSPFDMIGHDNAAQYSPRYQSVGLDSDSTSSDDSDAVIEIDASGVPVGPNVVREEILTNEGSVVISSDSESSDEVPTNNGSLNLQIADVHSILDNPHVNPEPPRRLVLPLRKRRGSPSTRAGPSREGINVKTETSGSDEELPTVVEVLPPKTERTPELIRIDSDSDVTIQINDDIKKNKSSNSKVKPNLDRTSFSLHASQQPSNDHSYCQEQDLFQISSDDEITDLSHSTKKKHNESSRRESNLPRSSHSVRAPKDHYSKIKSSSRHKCIIERKVYFTKSYSRRSSSGDEWRVAEYNESSSTETSSNPRIENKRRKRSLRIESSDDEYLPSCADRDRVKTKNKQEYFKRLKGKSKHSRTEESPNNRDQHNTNIVHSATTIDTDEELSSYPSSSRNCSSSKHCDFIYSSLDEDFSTAKKQNRSVSLSSQSSTSQVNNSSARLHSLKKKKKKKKRSKRNHSSDDEESCSNRKSRSHRSVGSRSKSKKKKSSSKSREKHKYKSVHSHSKVKVKKRRIRETSSSSSSDQ